MSEDRRPEAAKKREQRLVLLEDEIGRRLAESEASGELRAAPSFGKPLAFGDGYDETPAELRMGFKVLKDAGVVPAEVELMQRIEAQRAAIEADPQAADIDDRKRRLAEMRQSLALMLERLAATRSL